MLLSAPATTHEEALERELQEELARMEQENDQDASELMAVEKELQTMQKENEAKERDVSSAKVTLE